MNTPERSSPKPRWQEVLASIHGETRRCGECGDIYYRDEMKLVAEWNCLPCLAGEI